jgi:hypothetical protein
VVIGEAVGRHSAVDWKASPGFVTFSLTNTPVLTKPFSGKRSVYRCPRWTPPVTAELEGTATTPDEKDG